jgi:hypothetical protein
MEPFYQQIGSTGIGIRRQSIVLVDVLRMVLLAHQMMIEIGRHDKENPKSLRLWLRSTVAWGGNREKSRIPKRARGEKELEERKNEKVLFPPCTILHTRTLYKPKPKSSTPSVLRTHFTHTPNSLSTLQHSPTSQKSRRLHSTCSLG